MASQTGSGVVFKSVLMGLASRDEAAYRAQLTRLGFKPSRVADMVAGFMDGRLTMLQHMYGTGAVKLVDLDSPDNERGAEDQLAAVERGCAPDGGHHPACLCGRDVTPGGGK